MIKRLRRRMTLMVIAVLILVSAGIVLAIHYANERSIAVQAESTLSVLAENSGSRPSLPPDGSTPADMNETPPPKPEGKSDPSPRGYGERRMRGQPPEARDNRTVAAGLSNSYTIALNDDGTVASWTSDRTDLYSDLQISAMAEGVQAAGTDSGRIGSQFYRKTVKDGRTLLIVLDARLDYLAASNTLRSTILVAAVACLLLSLLALARMDRNDAGTDMKRFDLSHAVLDVTLPFESTVYEAGKTLEIDVPDGIDCLGNEEMIKQLTVILLSNALKYSDPGGRIEVNLKAKGKQREIRVFNTGEPIEPDNRERIFDRFWRADPAHGRDTGGHGLGLAIARSIVEKHKGRITVDSPEGTGNAFTVMLSGDRS